MTMRDGGYQKVADPNQTRLARIARTLADLQNFSAELRDTDKIIILIHDDTNAAMASRGYPIPEELIEDMLSHLAAIFRSLGLEPLFTLTMPE
jgi:hypothetical protein